MVTHAENTLACLPRAEAIARLNDKLRMNGCGGVIVVTRGVRNLNDFAATTLLKALATFVDFDPDNDPHGERDFGDFHLFGADLLWKIDYYDPEYQHGSADPADATQTNRVLTIMLANEY